MSFLSLVGVEFKKIKRSKILLILLVATVILWIPSILNVHMNFDMQAEGISPENNFFIQGFMGMSWFMFPASMVVGTVLLSQTERANKGILKMLSLTDQHSEALYGKVRRSACAGSPPNRYGSRYVLCRRSNSFQYAEL